jgi:CMP-N,N'-diacetyllegionaminic acid synthase
MSYRKKRILAVIPARVGSKEIPRKNLCKVGSESLVSHAGRLAVLTSWIDLAVISTDDKEIESEGISSGLISIGRRPPRLSDDTASSIDVWRHAWTEAEKLQGETFDISLLLEPTSPCRKIEDIRRVIVALVDHKKATAVTVSPSPAHYAPEKALTLSGSGGLNHYLGLSGSVIRRQDVPQYYHRNGICYGIRKNQLFEEDDIFGEDCEAIIIHRPVINIDSRQDLMDAQSWYEAAKKNTA